MDAFIERNRQIKMYQQFFRSFKLHGRHLTSTKLNIEGLIPTTYKTFDTNDRCQFNTAPSYAAYLSTQKAKAVLLTEIIHILMMLLLKYLRYWKTNLSTNKQHN